MTGGFLKKKVLKYFAVVKIDKNLRWRHHIWPLTSYMTLIFNVYKALALAMPMSKELLCNFYNNWPIIAYIHTHTEKHPIDTFIFEANYLLITCEATYTVNQVETTRVLSNRVGNVFGSGSHDTTLRNGGGYGCSPLKFMFTPRTPFTIHIFSTYSPKFRFKKITH